MAKQDIDVEVLLDAIGDVQEVIRAYDLKAEILTAILTLMVGMVAFVWHDHDTATMQVLYVVIVVTSFGALGCLLAVLFPMNNPAENVKLGTFKPAGIYFIGKDALEGQTVSDIAKKLSTVTWNEELVFELMKVSSIRQRKHVWFVGSLAASTIAFFSLFVLCLIKYC